MTTRKPYGYWKIEKNVVAEALKAMEEQDWDRLPAHKKLSKHGYHSLTGAISKHHGGIQHFRTKLGQTNTTKPNGYWQQEKNIISEAQQAMQEQNWHTLPSPDKLTKHGYGSLRSAIRKHYGGFQTIRTTLGQTNTFKPPGYWESLETTLTEARKAMQEQNWTKLPSDIQLRKHGYSSLTHAINSHGGIQTIRTKLGQTNTKKPQGYWQQKENIFHEVRQAMEEQKWTILPPEDILRKNGYNSLTFAITKYHGGIQTIRTTLGQTNPEKPKGYWKSLDNTIAEATKAMTKHNWKTLPPSDELKKYGYSSLYGAITKYHGGLNQFRTKLGQTNPDTKPNGYWKSLDNALKEAQQTMQQHEWDTLPSSNQLTKHGYSSLGRAIYTYHGGMQTFRKLLAEHITGKTQKQQLEEMLDEYIAA